MTKPGERIAEPWRNDSFAREWVARDDLVDFLALPRALAAAVVALELATPRTVVDVASGPGAFLRVFLERFPNARGIWLDASEPMLEAARENLAALAGRVTFRLGDLADLEAAGIPSGVDVILTSRALHHLDADGLAAFYRDATARLEPGGWLANLDHVGLPDAWDRRLRVVRAQMTGGQPRQTASHHHEGPLPRIEDHLRGLSLAGIDDVDVAWRAFHTCLFLGRKPAK